MSEPNEHRTSKAVESVLDYDAWFATEVEKGLAAANRGEFTDHEAIRVMIDSRYTIRSAKGAQHT